MALTISAPMRDRGAILASAVSELHSILPFDAVQLLRHEPRRSEMHEIFRTGYAADSAWALQHLFTQKYRLGFTDRLSPNDGLPPAISSVRPEHREDFVESRIYRDHLRTNGFLDGMSMELFAGKKYVGIAHFSARSPLGFSESARRAASGVRGLLGALILESNTEGTCAVPLTGAATAHSVHSAEPAIAWYTFSAPHSSVPLGRNPVPSMLENPMFQRHLEQFRSSSLSGARHLWDHANALSRLDLRRIGTAGEIAVGIEQVSAEERFRLSVQELRVLSLLCAGHDDGSIASRLQLSPRTVESHVLNARRKIGAKNRVEAVVRAITTASYLPNPESCPLSEVLGLAP